jgi:hypothetical protein
MLLQRSASQCDELDANKRRRFIDSQLKLEADAREALPYVSDAINLSRPLLIKRCRNSRPARKKSARFDKSYSPA